MGGDGIAGVLESTNQPLILAEVKLLGVVPAQGIFQEFLAALSAQVEPQLLVDVVANLWVIGFVRALQDLLNFLQVVTIVVHIVQGARIQRRVNFHFYDVAEVVGIEGLLAAIARVVNHRYFP
jgi:hypothetical protein